MGKFIKVTLLSLVLFVSMSFGWVKPYFSPYDDCEAQWLMVLDQAKSEIAISCYGLTNKKIVDKIFEKKNQGVKVIVCVDKLQSKGRADMCGVMASSGVVVVVKKLTALEHNKMCSIDGSKLAIIGSWNLSASANGQDNSIIVTNEKDIVKAVRAAIKRIYDRDTAK